MDTVVHVLNWLLVGILYPASPARTGEGDWAEDVWKPGFHPVFEGEVGGGCLTVDSRGARTPRCQMLGTQKSWP